MWWLNNDLLEVDTTADSVMIDFPDVGLQTLMGILRDGSELDTVAWEIEVFDPRGVDNPIEGLLPDRVSLSSPSPNPFNAQTRIDYSIPMTGCVNLSVYDISGRKVETLAEGVLNTGYHSATFDASLLPAGLYLVRLEAGGEVLIRKAVIVK